MPRPRWIGALLALGLMLWTVPARAGLVLDFSGGEAGAGTAPDGGGQTIGFSFTVLSPITIGALGMWDEGADGLSNLHIVGLWASDQTELATAIVSGSSNPVASSSGFGQWLFEDIAPLVLNPGTYFIGAFYQGGGDPDFLRTEATATTIPEVAFGTTRFFISGELAFPANANSDADDGINANLLTIPAAVPAPSTLLTVAIAVAGLSVVRVWRRR
jgi:hypothetical protein